MSVRSEKRNGRPRYRFQVGYKDPLTGQRKRKCSKWFATKREALQAEKDFLADVERGTAERKRITFGQLTEEWATSGATEIAKSIEERKKAVRLWFPELMDMDAQTVTPAVLQKMIRDNAGFLSLSTSRKNKILLYMRQAFDHGVKVYGLKDNPARALERFKKTDAERLKEVPILTPEEFEQFIAAIDDRHEEYARLFRFLFWTGCRLNEALSLTFDDIEGSRCRIWRQYDHREKTWRTLKSKRSRREIALPPALADIVEKQKEAYRDKDGYTSEWFVFGGPAHLPDTTVTRVKNLACDKAGLPRVKIHSFRHSHASYLLSHNVPIFKVSRRLGHSSTAITTDIYGHLIESGDDDFLDI